MELDMQRAGLLEALRTNPRDEDTFQALLEATAAEGATDELLADLSGLLADAEEPGAHARWALLLGRTYQELSEDLGLAAAAYQRAVDVDPGAVEALDGLKACLVRLEDWEGLLGALGQEAELREDPEDLAEIHFEMGTVWDIKLGDPAQAIRSYQEAFRTSPACVRALTAAREVYARQEHWAMVGTLLRMEARSVAETDSKVALLRELAGVFRDKQDDLAGALGALEEALNLDPDSEEVFAELEQLEALLASEEGAGGGFGAEEEVLEEVLDEVELGDLDLPDEPVTSSDDEGPAAEVGIEDVAVDALVVDDPAEEAGTDGPLAAEPLAAEEGTSEELVVEALAAEELAAEELVADELVSEELVADELEAEEPAAEEPAAEEPAAEEPAAEEPAAEEPAAEDPVAEELEAEEPAAEEPAAEEPAAEDPVADELEAEESAAEEPAAEEPASEEPAAEEPASEEPAAPGQAPVSSSPDNLFAAGALADGSVYCPQAEGAVPFSDYLEHLRDLAAAAGDDSDAAADLAEAELANSEGWRELQTALRKRHGASPGGRLEQARRLGLLAEWAGNVDRAVDAWRHVLQGEPRDLQAADALKRLYRATGKWNAVVDLLKREVEDLPDGAVAAKVAVYQEMVRIYSDELKLDVMVNTTYQNILKTDPGNPEAIDALIVQYEKMRRWPDLVGVLQQKIELATEALAQVALLKQLATIFVDRFSNQAEAIKAFERVLSLAPDDVEAMGYLKQMYERRRDWEKLVSIEEREALLVEDADERASALTSVAQRATEKLKRSPRPTELWGAVLELRPGDATALAALEQVHEGNKDWEALAGVLSAKAELAGAEADRLVVLEKLGRLYGERLKDRGEAVGVWRQVLEVAPDHARARESLKRAYIEAQDWEALAEQYTGEGAGKELVRILESQVGVVKDDQTKVDLLFRAAALYEGPLGQPDRAVRVLERVLTVDERNLAAAQRLIPVYEEKRDYKRLIRCHEIRLEFEEELPERRTILSTLAGLCEEKGRDAGAAFRWLFQAARENPADAELRSELERLAEELQNWEELVALYRDNRAPLAQHPEDLVALDLRLGRALAEELRETSEAMQAFSRVLVLSPDNTEALYALETLYKRTSAWDELLTTLTRLFELVDDPAERRRVLMDRALVEEEQLGDVGRAVDTYRVVLSESPEDLEVLGNLRLLLRGQQRWSELAGVIGVELTLREAGAAAEGEIVPLKLELGRLQQHHLEQTEEAIACFRDVLALVPDHADTVVELEGLLDLPDHLPAVFEILYPAYEGNSRHEDLVALLERRIASMEDPVERLDMLLRAAEIQDARLGDAAAAFATYSRGFQLDPEDERARAHLEEIAERVDCWGALVELYREVITYGLREELASSLYLSVARVEDEKLGASGPAEEAFRAVLELDPECAPALDALEQLYTRSEKWEELLGVYRRKQELAGDPEEQRALSFRIGFLWEEMLGNLAEATATYRAILDGDESNERALEALDRLHTAQEQWPELADNLRRRIALAQPADDLALTTRLAALLERQLGAAHDSIALYHSVLEREPEDTVSLDALEQLMGDPEHRLAIARILEPHYATAESWDRLVAVLEIQLDAADDAFERLELLHRIGRLREQRLGAPDAAFATYGRAMGEVPTDEATRAELHRLAELLGNWSDLVALYEEEVGRLADPELSARFLSTVAQVQEAHLENVDGALAAWRKVLELSPDSVDVLDALIRLLQTTEEWQELVEVLLRKIDVVVDGPQRVDLLAQTAILYEEMLRQPLQAIESLQRILELDPDSAPALDGLERLQEEQEAWPELLEVLERKVALAPSGADKVALLAKSGTILEEQLEHSERAIEAYRSLLELDPTNLPTLLALDRLLGVTEDWVGQMEILERRAELASETDDRIELQFRVAKLWEVRLGDNLRAVDGYRELLSEVPGHTGTRQALVAMVRDGRDERSAAEVLLPLLRGLGEWGAVVEVLELLLTHLEDALERIQLLEEAARIREDHLQDQGAAFDTLARAFTEHPERDETLELLESLAERAAIWDRCVALIESDIEERDPLLAAPLLRRAARILEEEMATPAEAIERFRRVLQLAPEDETAIAALDRLYEQQGLWPDLAELLRLEISLAVDGSVRQVLTLRLAALLESMLEQVPEAIAAYSDVLLDEPQQPEALAALERLFAGGLEPLTVAGILAPLYEDASEWEKLIQLKEALLPHLPDAPARLSTLREAASIGLEKLGRADLALYWYGRAYVLEPSDDDIAMELERLASLTAAWQDVVAIYLEAHDPVEDAVLKCAVLLRVARIFEEELDDRARAEQCFLSVLDLDERHRDALGALDRIYQMEGRWSELASILEREIRLEEDEPALIDLIYRSARLHEHQLGDLDLAVDHYRRILGYDPLHEGALKALETIYVHREEWEPLFDIYQKQADIAVGDEGRAAIYAKMAHLASEMLERPSDAIYMWNQVLDLLGEDRAALKALAELYSTGQQWAELVSVLERLVRVAADNEEEATLLASLGRIHGDELEDDAAARTCWEQVVALEPDHREGLLALKALYRKTEAWEELVDTIERLLEMGGGTSEEQAELWSELGRLQGDTLLRPDAAIEAWRKVLALTPDSMAAIRSLERLHETQEDWPACAQILELKADLTSEREAKVEILLRVAGICLERTYERERAVAFLEGVLELDPANTQASLTLERVFEDDGQAQRLLDVLLHRLDHSGDAVERVELLTRAAVICESQLDNPVNAFYCVLRAYQEDPTNEDVGEELERLARAAGQWEALLDLYEGLLGQADEGQQTNLHRRIGRIYAEELEAHDEAIGAYQQVLRADRGDEDALRALEQLFRKAGRWAELVAVLQLRLEAQGDPDERAAYHNQMGQILEEQLQQAERAVASYRNALRERDDDETALAALERIFTREAQWRELIEVLTRRAAASFEAQRIVGFTRRIAEIWETSLQVPDRAIEAYREILRIDPLSTEACQALERLYTGQDKWRELLDIYLLWLEAVDEPARKCELLAKMARIHEEEFHAAAEAIGAYEQILQYDPDNLNAVRSLERLNRDQQRWPELIEVYRRHLAVVHGDRPVTVELLLSIGRVYAEQLRSVEQAIEAYREVLEVDGNHVDALTALAGLYEQVEEWEATIGVLQRLRQLSTEPAQQVLLNFRMGELHRDQLGDAKSAEDQLYAALEVDPFHLPSIAALRDMAYAVEDWRNAIRLLRRQEDATQDLVAKAAVFLEIGKIYQERENDPLTAATYFERCVELDPENVEAAAPLSEMYLHEKRWERAEPLLDLLVRKLGMSRHVAHIHLLHHKAGLCAENLFRDDKALRHYRNAWELDATHLPTLEGLGRLLYKREDWDRAFQVYQTILVHHREQQTDAQIVEIFFRLGAIKLKVGERSRGRTLFEKALEVDPLHVPTLEALIELHEKQGDWERVVAYKGSLLQAVGPEEDLRRFNLTVDIANIWREKLRNIAKAIEAYNAALAVDPKSRQVMHHLLNLYTQEKQWQQSVEILERTIGLEERSEKVARYCYTTGVIYRDELRDHDRAIELFDRALDADVGLLKAFEAIDRLQTANRNWAQLERAYRKMIKRITDAGVGGEELQVLLWRNLGEIYRSRMARYGDAATAFGMASRLIPGSMQLHEIIAELYEHIPDAKDKAIAEHRRMLELDRFRYGSYKALNRLYMETGQYDKAWCMCAALTILNQAAADEREFYEKYRAPTIKYAARPIGREMWTNSLYHPNENLHLGGIFSVLAGHNPFPTSSTKDWGLRKRDVHDLRKPLLFNKVFNSTLQVLNLAASAPHVYLKRAQFAGMKNGYLVPWSLVIGPDMLQGRPDRELAFLLGKMLTLYRPEHYLASVLPVSHLKILFFGAWQLTHPDANVPVPTEPDAFAELLRVLQRTMPPPMLVDLHKRVSTVIRARMEINLSRWVDAVEATSNRVGLLLCGDLDTATKLLRSEQVGSIGRGTTQERLEDLFLFAVSEQYFGLRQALGLTIG